MTPLGWLRSLWRTLTASRQLDEDLHDEIRSYVDLEVEDAVARGEDPADARRRTLAAAGGVTSIEETVRARRTGAWLTEAVQDGRYGLRMLRRAPAFALAVVLTLAIGIGATAAMATTARTILLTPLPYPASDRLVVLTGHGYFGEYLQYVERSTTMDVAAWSGTAPKTLTGRGEPVRLTAVVGTPDLFTRLGVVPAAGSGWGPGDAAPGAEPVAVLSDRIWRERFGADLSAVGAIAELDGIPHRIRGVMPAGFAFPNADTDLWTPVTLDPADRVATWSVGGTIIGRLRDTATLESARAEVQTMAPGFAPMFPWRMPPGYGEDASVVRLQDQLVGDVDVMLTAAVGAVIFVLIIACLNVGVLLLGRSMSRRVEMATRAALGATRRRLMRQVLAECAALACVGGATALVVAGVAVRSLTFLLPPDLPRLHEVAPDGWLVGLVGVLTLLSGIAIAAVPVWRVARPGVVRMPTVRAASGDRATRAATRVLVTVEVALAVTLVIGAGLLGRSLDRLLDVDPGFVPAGVSSAVVSPPLHRYPSAAARRALYDSVLDRINAMEQISSAAVTDRLPFAAPPWGSVFAIEGRPDPATESGDWPWTDYRAIVSPAYFDTLGIDVTSGRPFAASDTGATTQVAVISEALAREHWPGENPVGRRFRFPGMPAGQWIEIVGVAGDVRWERLNEAPKTALYLPLGQWTPEAMTIVTRATDDDARGLAGPIRSAVQSVDAEAAVDRIASLDVLVANSARTSRFLAVLFAGFAVVGVLLGAVGIYGVTADAVARRRQEIAIRMAIGAEAGTIIRLVVGQSVTLALAGVAVGLAGAWLGGRYLSSLLFGIAPNDPVTFVAVPLALLVVVVFSCVVPARRATRINPLASLRNTEG